MDLVPLSGISDKFLRTAIHSQSFQTPTKLSKNSLTCISSSPSHLNSKLKSLFQKISSSTVSQSGRISSKPAKVPSMELGVTLVSTSVRPLEKLLEMKFLLNKSKLQIPYSERNKNLISILNIIKIIFTI